MGPYYKPLKCFHCKCDHDQKCSCPCVYHLANNCPDKKKGESNAKAELGLFMQVNTPSMQAAEAMFLIEAVEDFERDEIDTTRDEDIVLLSNTLEELGLDKNKKEDVSIALIDCACPTTVAGSQWAKDFVSKLSLSQKDKIKTEATQRVFKFGGGEKRKSKVALTLPCNIGTKMNMEETGSGHFSIKIETPEEGSQQNELLCLLNQNSEELTLKEIKKLHHYWGHASVEKLKVLIKSSGRLTEEVKRLLINVGNECESCKVNSNRKPVPRVSIPKALKVNQIVSIDLKEYGEGDQKYILYAIDVFSRLTVGVFIAN